MMTERTKSLLVEWKRLYKTSLNGTITKTGRTRMNSIERELLLDGIDPYGLVHFIEKQ